jgi:hypothetical protein
MTGNAASRNVAMSFVTFSSNCRLLRDAHRAGSILNESWMSITSSAVFMASI